MDFEGLEYPLLLHMPYFQLYRKQVVKQPDLVLALFLRGDRFSAEEKARDFAYYEPLTVRDSSLSACVQAVVAAEVGHLELAYDYFGEAALMDLGDLEHNTRDGLHMASLAGSWIAAVAGFGGMRDHGGELSFRPRLPAGARAAALPRHLPRPLPAGHDHARRSALRADPRGRAADGAPRGRDVQVGGGKPVDARLERRRTPAPSRASRPAASRAGAGRADAFDLLAELARHRVARDSTSRSSSGRSAAACRASSWPRWSPTAGGLGSFGAQHLAPEEIDEGDRGAARPHGAVVRGQPLGLQPRHPRERAHARALRRRGRSGCSRCTRRPGSTPPPFPERFGWTFEEQLEPILAAAPPALSFVYGIPAPDMLAACRERGIATIGTAITVDEAVALDEAGVDAIVATGFEAGGHRVAFLAVAGGVAGRHDGADPGHGRFSVEAPVIAAGGIADARGVVAALTLGAEAVQIGTAFLATDESAAAPAHKE